MLTNAPFSALYYMFYKQLQTRLTKVDISSLIDMAVVYANPSLLSMLLTRHAPTLDAQEDHRFLKSDGCLC